MISLPDDLLEVLDAAALKAQQTRSAFIRDAVRERIARGTLDALRRRFRDGSWNAEDRVRAERDRRSTRFPAG